MKYLEDYSDERHKAWCIHCGKTLADVARNRDHVPSKSLLSKRLRCRGADYDRGTGGDNDYLPQVLVCRRCNGGFSPDENYLLCVLHAVAAGSLYPDPGACPEAAAILRSNRHVVRALKATPDGQLFLFDDLKPFTVYPDMRRIERVVEKNARVMFIMSLVSRFSNRRMNSLYGRFRRWIARPGKDSSKVARGSAFGRRLAAA